MRKGRSLEKERDRLQADLAGMLASQVTSVPRETTSPSQLPDLRIT